MSPLTCVLCVLSLAIPATRAFAQDNHGEPADAEAPERNKLDLDLDKDVLVFVEPVREDGTIDYIAALNKKYSEGVTNENNAFRALYLLLPKDESTQYMQEYHAAMRAVLDIDDDEVANAPAFVPWPDFAEARGIDLDAAWEIRDAFEENPFSQAINPDYQAWLEASEPAFVAAAQAVEKSKYWAPMIDDGEGGLLIGVILPHLSDYRSLARGLDARACRAAAKGDEAKVLDSLRTIHRLAWHASHEPFLISNLVANSIDALGSATVKRLLAGRVLSDQALADLAALEQSVPARVPIAQTVMEGERCFGLDTYMQLMAGRVDGGGLGLGAGGNDAMGRLAGSGAFDVNRGLKQFSRYYYQLAKIMAIKNYAGRQRVLAMFEENFEKEMARMGLVIEVADIKLPNPTLLTKDARTDAMTRLLMSILAPALGAAGNAETRNLATERCMLAAIACERYRLKHDKLPADLDALVPAYLDAVPTDPFIDEPVRYKRGDNGFTVYALGRNLQDDGGVENPDDRERGDWVFEVQ
jgi:hypothetical protein